MYKQFFQFYKKCNKVLEKLCCSSITNLKIWLYFSVQSLRKCISSSKCNLDITFFSNQNVTIKNVSINFVTTECFQRKVSNIDKQKLKNIWKRRFSFQNFRSLNLKKLIIFQNLVKTCFRVKKKNKNKESTETITPKVILQSWIFPQEYQSKDLQLKS